MKFNESYSREVTLVRVYAPHHWKIQVALGYFFIKREVITCEIY